MSYLLFLIFSFLFGLILGSFANCLIWRLHKEESLWGRSYCPNCHHKISWYDNIPVLSFLILRGKCRHCHKKISWQYPLVEIIMALLFVASAYFLQANQFIFFDRIFILELLRNWILIFVLVVIFVYDLRWYLIPDIVVLPATAIILVINLFLGFSWWIILLCALIGAGFFFIQFAVSSGKWMGGGDIRLGLLFGVFFGRFDFLILSILSSYMIGSLVCLVLLSLGKKKWTSQVPLGVFLAPGAILALFFGDKIISWYF